MSGIQRLNMIIVLVKDVDQAVTFYQKLGLILTSHLKGQWAEYALGDITVSLCPTDIPDYKRCTGIVLEVDDIRDYYARLKGQGVEFLGEPIERVHGIVASLKDPSGNIIDLYQPAQHKVQDLALDCAQGNAKCCKKPDPVPERGCCGGGTC